MNNSFNIQDEKIEEIVNTMTDMILEIDNKSIIVFASQSTSTIPGVENYENYAKQSHQMSGIDLQNILNFIFSSHDDQHNYKKENISSDTFKCPKQEKITINEDKLKYIYNYVSEAIFVVQDEKIVFCNKIAEFMIGRKFDNLLYMCYDEFKHEQRYQKADSDIKFVDLITVKILWNGKPAILNLISDTTAIKQAELKVEKYKQKLEIKNTRYEDLMNLLQDGFYEVDLNSNIVFLSQSALNTLKIKNPSSVMNKPISDFFINKSDHDELKKLLIQKGEIVRHKTKIKNNLNEIIDISITIKLLVNKNGEYNGSYGTFRDITHIIQKEQEIEFLHKVFDNIQYALVVFDSNKIIRYANVNLNKLISPENALCDCIGKRIDNFIFPETISFNEMLKKIKEDGKWIGPSKVFNLTNNTLIPPVDIIFSPFLYKDEEMIIGSYYDSSKYKKLEQKIIEQSNNYIELSNHMQILLTEMNQFNEIKKTKIMDLELTLDSIFQGISNNGHNNNTTISI